MPEHHLPKLTPSVITFLLAILAFTGNFLSLPLFYGVDLIFGSIATMIAVARLGTLNATLVAAMGGLYTWSLWGHPYAMLILTLEGLCVSLLYRKKIHNLVIADTIYWTFVGAPLVILFYHLPLNHDWTQTWLIALKQPLNGLFNTIIASFILYGIQIYQHKVSRPELNKIGIQSLLFNILLAMTLISGTIPIIIESHKAVNSWETELAQQLDTAAKRFSLLARARTNNRLNLDVLESNLNNLSLNKFMSAGILDNQGNIIKRRGELLSLNTNGTTQQSNSLLTIWFPAGNMSKIKRWRNGRYVYSKVFTLEDSKIRVIIEHAAEPIVEKTELQRLDLFVILLALVVIALISALLVSRWLTSPLDRLNNASLSLIDQITGSRDVIFPNSIIAEYETLSRTLNKMASKTAESYNQLSDIRNDLENKVRERTIELERLSMVASRTTNGVIITDADGKVIWLNDGFTRISGYNLDDLLNRKPGELLQGKETDIDSVNEISKAIKNNQRFTVELVNYTKSGNPYWIHIDCDPIIDDNDKTIGFIAIESDISKRKRAEMETHKTATLLNNVLNAATEVSIIATDTNGVITIFNSGAEKMLGYNAEEMIGKQTPYIIHLAEEVENRGQELSEIFGKTISGFSVFIAKAELEGQETREWTYVRKDGVHLPVILSVTTMRTNTGEIIGYLGIARDITDQKRIDRMKNEFVSTVSHELRTPLTSINGTLGLITGGALGNMPEQYKPLIDVAVKNSLRLTHLIDDLLDMEKIAEGKMYFDMQSQNVMSLVEQAITENQHYADQYEVAFVLSSNCKGAYVNADKNRLLQVLANFMSNAAKFSPTNSEVEIRAECNVQSVRLSVLDNGPGIPDNFKDHLFKKFSQADSSDTRQNAGTGLGLSITKELVNHMGGEVGYCPNPAGGSIFWCEFPAYHQ